MAERSLRFDLIGRDKSLGRTLKKGERDTERFRQRISGIGVAAGGAALAGLGILGAGALKLASDFDDAYDTIRVGTGKTGKSLAGLKDDFRAVVRDIPTDFATASTAVAELNRRTGQTGKPLQALAKRTLELTRLTGGDLTTNIASVTRLFGDWGIKTGDQSKTLDKLFRASQATGVGVDQLAQSVVKFGAPLRQLGFSFDASIALLAKFEKEGVNSNLVMSGMRIALGKLAKAGKDPQKGFLDLAQRIKDAGSSAAANRIAIEAFGQRAGPDMAAAIREGRLSIKGLQDQIAGGKDTILGAARDAEDFGEKWKRVSNRLKLLAEPVVTAGLDTLSTKMGQLEGFLSKNLIPKLGGLRTAWDNNRDAILGLLQPFDDVNGKSQTADERAQQLADSLTSVTEGLGKFARGAQTAADFLNGLERTSSEVGHNIGEAFKSINKPLFGFISAILSANHKVIAAGATMAEALHLPQAKALRRAEQNMGRFLAEAKADLAAVDAKAQDTATKVPGGNRSGFHRSLIRAGKQARDFRGEWNRQIGQIRGKTVDVKARSSVEISEKTRQGLLAMGIKGYGTKFYAAGGGVYGPGGPTDDRVPAMLSAGEHVWTAKEVKKAGGHGAVEQLRREVRGYATGGAVDVRFKASKPPNLVAQFLNPAVAATTKLGRMVADKLASAVGKGLSAAITKAAAGGGSPAIKAFIKSTDRLPYVWGAAGPGAYDCSGLARAVYGLVCTRGGGQGQRYFTTASIGTHVAGLKPGLGGVLQIGVTPGQGHMAGSYAGLGFEAESSRTGIKIGSAASSPGSFARHFHMAKGGPIDERLVQLFARAGADVGGDQGRLRVDGKVLDQGGYLMPGTTIAHNNTGRPERVMGPGEPVIDYRRLGQAVAQALRDAPPVVAVDDVHAGLLGKRRAYGGMPLGLG
jgi:cell wall-associated NlpC family hydrolase